MLSSTGLDLFPTVLTIMFMINRRRNKPPRMIAATVNLVSVSIRSPTTGPRKRPNPIVVTDTAAFEYTSF